MDGRISIKSYAERVINMRDGKFRREDREKAIRLIIKGDMKHNDIAEQAHVSLHFVRKHSSNIKRIRSHKKGK
jgi:DNA invertase Pin-like site-specific DNA recombinase